MTTQVLELPKTKGPVLKKRGTMRAATIARPGQLKINEVKKPEIKEDEILYRLEGCGMCASTIPKWEGREWFNYPLEPGDPGHEGYGIIEKVGTGVTDLKKGDRVAAISYNALAEYDKAKANHVAKIPDELKYMPFPGEPLGCAMNIFERSDIRKGQTVAIIGVGFLGVLLIQLAKKAGAHVIALSRRPYSLEIANNYHADKVVPLDDHNKVIEKVKKITGGGFCDRVIEATGKQWPLDLAGEITKVRGKMIVAGFHQGGLRNVNMQLWNWRGIDVINAHERDPLKYVEGMKKAVDATLNCEIDFTPLLTHYFFPDEVGKAFDVLVKRPEGFVKGIVKF